MYCTKCGSEIPDHAKFCVKCGAKTVYMDPKKAGGGSGEEQSSEKTGTGQDPVSKRTGTGGNRTGSQRTAGSSGNRKPQDNSRSRGKTTPEKNGNKKLLVLLIIAIFALAAAIGVMAYLNFGNGKKDLKQDTADSRVEKEADEDDDKEEGETKDNSSGGFSFFRKDKDSTEAVKETAEEDLNEASADQGETADDNRKEADSDRENTPPDTDSPDDSGTASEPVKIPET